jgi:hypothetical protein
MHHFSRFAHLNAVAALRLGLGVTGGAVAGKRVSETLNGLLLLV